MITQIPSVFTYQLIRSIAIQGDGKIMAAGGVSLEKKSQFFLARYLADGTLDPDFGAGGIAITSFSSNQLVKSVAIDSDGSIIAGGFAESITIQTVNSKQLAAALSAVMLVGVFLIWLVLSRKGCPPYCIPIPDPFKLHLFGPW